MAVVKKCDLYFLERRREIEMSSSTYEAFCKLNIECFVLFFFFFGVRLSLLENEIAL